MTSDESTAESPREMTRWQTDCCGYLVNLSAPGIPPADHEPTTIRVYGRGTYIAGDCPGCDEQHPEIEKVGGDDE
jgi:hypothetical protein